MKEIIIVPSDTTAADEDREYYERHCKAARAAGRTERRDYGEYLDVDNALAIADRANIALPVTSPYGDVT